jgi:hypothetical protein
VSELSDALKRACQQARVSYKVLSDRLLAEEGLHRGKDTVNLWANGRQRPWPEELFAVERVLGLAPGQLSKLDGYIPASMRPVRSVVDAITHDANLSPELRQALIASYRAFTKNR